VSHLFDLKDERTLRALDANYLDSFGAIMGCSARGEFCDRRDVALLCCGAPMVEFNWAHVRRPLGNVAAALEHAERYFAPRRLPYRIELRGHASPDTERARELIRGAGFEPASAPVPGMALAPIASAHPAPKELRIEAVSDEESLDAFARAAFRGFGFPENAASAMLTPQLWSRPQVEAFVGRVGGEPVATAMLIASGAVAGIYWVATVPEARRRGYGEALTWAAVQAGRRAGCTVASLQASAMGRPVYERMGFQHVIDYERFQRN
jgi:GNAT superfamily N-acetyltransferase